MTYSDEFLEFLSQYEGYYIRGSYTYNPKWASGHDCGVCPNDKCLEDNCTDARSNQDVVCTKNPDGYCVINILGYVCAFEVDDILEGSAYSEGWLDEDDIFFIFEGGDVQEFGVIEGVYVEVKKVVFEKSD